MAGFDKVESGIPPYFQKAPPLVDHLETETSIVQEETIKDCLPLLNQIDDPKYSPYDFNEFGLPCLEKDKHVEFLLENLAEFPAPFVGIDASRPWMVYWALLGLYLLGEDVSRFRSRQVLPVSILNSLIWPPEFLRATELNASAGL
jgi:protein farnesyltransferase subunit beta